MIRMCPLSAYNSQFHSPVNSQIDEFESLCCPACRAGWGINLFKALKTYENTAECPDLWSGMNAAVMMPFLQYRARRRRARLTAWSFSSGLPPGTSRKSSSPLFLMRDTVKIMKPRPLGGGIYYERTTA